MHNQTTVLELVMAVPLITWVAVFIYMLSVDRAVTRLEQRLGKEEDL